jgi:hypothetical protein
MKEFWNWYCNLIERLPLPERSGTKGAILALVFLSWGITPIGTGGTPLDAIVCEIAPWKCLNRGDSDLPESANVRVWRFVSNVYFGPPKTKGLAQCSCHYDYRKDGSIMHLTFDRSPTCDSVRGEESDQNRDFEVWQDMCAERGNDGICSSGTVLRAPDSLVWLEDGEWRYHCTKDSRYSRVGVIKEREAK